MIRRCRLTASALRRLFYSPNSRHSQLRHSSASLRHPTAHCLGAHPGTQSADHLRLGQGIQRGLTLCGSAIWAPDCARQRRPTLAPSAARTNEASLEQVELAAASYNPQELRPGAVLVVSRPFTNARDGSGAAEDPRSKALYPERYVDGGPWKDLRDPSGQRADRACGGPDDGERDKIETITVKRLVRDTTVYRLPTTFPSRARSLRTIRAPMDWRWQALRFRRRCDTGDADQSARGFHQSIRDRGRDAFAFNVEPVDGDAVGRRRKADILDEGAGQDLWWSRCRRVGAKPPRGGPRVADAAARPVADSARHSSSPIRETSFSTNPSDRKFTARPTDGCA